MVAATACWWAVSLGGLFLAATRFAWGIVRGGDVSLETTYYYLLVPVTLPVTIVFVYLNWLALSIFKTA